MQCNEMKLTKAFLLGHQDCFLHMRSDTKRHMVSCYYSASQLDCNCVHIRHLPILFYPKHKYLGEGKNTCKRKNQTSIFIANATWKRWFGKNFLWKTQQPCAVGITTITIAILRQGNWCLEGLSDLSEVILLLEEAELPTHHVLEL